MNLYIVLIVAFNVNLCDVWFVCGYDICWISEAREDDIVSTFHKHAHSSVWAPDDHTHAFALGRERVDSEHHVSSQPLVLVMLTFVFLLVSLELRLKIDLDGDDVSDSMFEDVASFGSAFDERHFVRTLRLQVVVLISDKSVRHS